MHSLLIVLLLLAGLTAIAWLVVFSLVFGDRQRALAVDVVDAPGTTPRRMELREAPRLPNWRGHDYVTLGTVIRTRIADALDHPAVHAPALRREAWLGYRQSRWLWWGFWLAWYGISKRFRATVEADAATHETAEWPQLLTIINLAPQAGGPP
jgi:hypothetical protein